MMLARCLAATVVLTFVTLSPLWADRRDAGPTMPAGKTKLPSKMPMTGLAPSKLDPNLCVVRYRISTTSPECQAFFDQALGYYYSYVWMEASRSFEMALQYDPECPLAWWGLSRALERWGKSNHTEALLKADKFKDRASHREQQLILARMQEKGQAPRRIEASRAAQSGSNKTQVGSRPLCAFPALPRYRPGADPSSAAGFTCTQEKWPGE